MRLTKLLVYIILFSLVIYSCSSDFAYNDRDIRFIQSTIQTVNKKSIILQDGTIWGFGHFSINTPGDIVTVTFYESSISGTIYLNGVEQSVSYLGTTYDGRGSINDILQFNEGRFKFVSHIDSSATFVTLDDSTKWIIKPDMRKEAKKWTKDDKVILGNTKTFIANPRTNQIAIVRQVK